MDAMGKESLSIIIPTKDRPLKLCRLLESIGAQEKRPCQIIVVDGGEKPVQELLDRFLRLNVDYIRKIPASLTAQRNTGIRALCAQTTLVGFLDDDIVLQKDCLRNLMQFWQTAAEDIGGVALNNMSDAYKKPTLPERLFLVNADTPGRILRSGYQSKLCSLPVNTQVEWLVGCAMVWRRRVFQELMFDEWFGGYARYEDVDFSYRAGKKYKLFVVAGAKVLHQNSLENPNFSFSLGKMEIVNRLYFVRKNPPLSVGWCYWSCLGFFLNNIIKGVFPGNRRYWNRAGGNLAGLFVSVTARGSRRL